MRPCLIKGLYSLLVINAATIYNVFEAYKEDIIRLFASEDHSRFDVNLKHFKGRNEQDKTAVFIAKFFKIMSTIFMNSQKLQWIKKSEANYSEYLVWQFIKKGRKCHSFVLTWANINSNLSALKFLDGTILN